MHKGEGNMKRVMKKIKQFSSVLLASTMIFNGSPVMIYANDAETSIQQAEERQPADETSTETDAETAASEDETEAEQTADADGGQISAEADVSYVVLKEDGTELQTGGTFHIADTAAVADNAPAVEGYTYAYAMLNGTTEITELNAADVTEGTYVAFYYTENQTEEASTNTQTVFTYDDSSVSVTAELSDPAAVPAGAEFRVAELSPDFANGAYLDALNESAGDEKTYTAENTALYDVGFFVVDADGVATEKDLTSGEVTLNFQFKDQKLADLGAENGEEVDLVHLPLKNKDNYQTAQDATSISADDIAVDVLDDEHASASLDADGTEQASVTLDNLSVVAAAVPSLMSESSKTYQMSDYLTSESYLKFTHEKMQNEEIYHKGNFPVTAAITGGDKVTLYLDLAFDDSFKPTVDDTFVYEIPTDDGYIDWIAGDATSSTGNIIGSDKSTCGTYTITKNESTGKLTLTAKFTDSNFINGKNRSAYFSLSGTVDGDKINDGEEKQYDFLGMGTATITFNKESDLELEKEQGMTAWDSDNVQDFINNLKRSSIDSQEGVTDQLPYIEVGSDGFYVYYALKITSTGKNTNIKFTDLSKNAALLTYDNNSLKGIYKFDSNNNLTNISNDATFTVSESGKSIKGKINTLNDGDTAYVIYRAKLNVTQQHQVIDGESVNKATVINNATAESEESDKDNSNDSYTITSNPIDKEDNITGQIDNKSGTIKWTVYLNLGCSLKKLDGQILTGNLFLGKHTYKEGSLNVSLVPEKTALRNIQKDDFNGTDAVKLISNGTVQNAEYGDWSGFVNAIKEACTSSGQNKATDYKGTEYKLPEGTGYGAVKIEFETDYTEAVLDDSGSGYRVANFAKFDEDAINKYENVEKEKNTGIPSGGEKTGALLDSGLIKWNFTYTLSSDLQIEFRDYLLYYKKFINDSAHPLTVTRTYTDDSGTEQTETIAPYAAGSTQEGSTYYKLKVQNGMDQQDREDPDDSTGYLWSTNTADLVITFCDAAGSEVPQKKGTYNISYYTKINPFNADSDLGKTENKGTPNKKYHRNAAAIFYQVDDQIRWRSDAAEVLYTRVFTKTTEDWIQSSGKKFEKDNLAEFIRRFGEKGQNEMIWRFAAYNMALSSDDTMVFKDTFDGSASPMKLSHTEAGQAKILVYNGGGSGNGNYFVLTGDQITDNGENGFTLKLNSALTNESGETFDPDAEYTIVYYMTEMTAPLASNKESNTATITINGIQGSIASTADQKAAYSKVSKSIANLDADGEYAGDGYVVYNIDVNSAEETLNNGNDLILKDTMGNSLSFDRDIPVTFEDENGNPVRGTAEEVDGVLTFTVPDATYVHITYTDYLNSRTGGESVADRTNEVSLYGSSSAPIESSRFTIKFKSNAGAKWDNPRFTVYKYDPESQEPLKGVEFEYRTATIEQDYLYGGKSITGWTENAEKLTSDEFGLLWIEAPKDTLIEFNEKKAPNGYMLNSDKYYFVFTDGTEADKKKWEDFLNSSSNRRKIDFNRKEFSNPTDDKAHVFILDGNNKSAGTEIKNYKSSTTTVTAKKEWTSDIPAISADDKIQFTLYRQAEGETEKELVDTKYLPENDSDPWTVRWTGLDINNPSGVKYKYTVEESNIPDGYQQTSISPHETTTTVEVSSLIKADGKDAFCVDIGKPMGDDGNTTYTYDSVIVNPSDEVLALYCGNPVKPHTGLANKLKYILSQNNGYTSTAKKWAVHHFTDQFDKYDVSDNNDGGTDGQLFRKLINGANNNNEDISGNLILYYSSEHPEYQPIIRYADTLTANEENSLYDFVITNSKQDQPNTPKGTLQIVKEFGTDSDLNAENLSDAQKQAITFTITKPDGTTETVKYSDFNNGIKTFSDIATGIYTVTELNTISGYTCTSQVSVTDGTVAVTEGNTATVTFTNTYKKETTSLTVKKVWELAAFENSYDPAMPNSVTFTLYADGHEAKNSEGDTITRDVSASTDWNVTIKDLPKYNDDGSEIKYTVKENDIAGYTGVISTPEPGDTSCDLIVTNSPVTGNKEVAAELKLKKTNMNGAALKGATFELYDGNTSVATYTGTDKSEWTISSDDLSAEIKNAMAVGETKTFTLKETAPPEGYLKAADILITLTKNVSKEWEGTGADRKYVTTTTYSFASDAAEDGTIIVKNQPATAEGSVELKGMKVLSGRTTPLEEGEFTFALLDQDKRQIATATNDADGSFVFKDIDALKYKWTSDSKPSFYTYYIREVQDSANHPGIKFDDDVYTVSVNIYDAGNGKLNTKVVYKDANGATADKAVFNNTYEPAGKAVIKAAKHLSGRDWEDADAFTFVLTSVDGAPLRTAAGDQESLTATATKGEANDSYAARTPAFEELVYSYDDLAVRDAAGNITGHDSSRIFTYNIHEQCLVDGTDKNPSAGGYEQDGITYAKDQQVTVKVADSGSGSLIVTYLNPATGEYDNTLNAPSFENTYTAGTTTGRISLTKNLEGRSEWLDKDQFTFRLTAGSNTAGLEKTPMPDKDTVVVTKDTADHTASFGDITYTEPGDYHYTITEVIPDGAVNNVKDGITYATASHAATVKVTDDGNGSLSATTVYYNETDPTPPVFTNTYHAEGTNASFEIWKYVNDELQNSGSYSIQIIDDNDDHAGMEAADQSSIVKGDVLGTVAMTYIEGSTSNGHASYELNTVKFTRPGVYQFKLKEKLPDGIDPNTHVYQGVTYDTHECTATVTVSDDTSGKLTASVSYSDSAEGAVFHNAYVASGEALIKVSKHITGRDWMDTDAFTFVLTGKDGAPLRTAEGDQESLTAIAAKGESADSYAARTPAFAELIYQYDDLKNADGTHSDKTFTYNIHEQCLVDGVDMNPSGGGYVKDGLKYAADQQVKVNVHDNGDGSLLVTYGTNGENTIDAPEFYNSYQYGDATAELKAEKQAEEGVPFPQDGYQFLLSSTRDDTPMPAGASSNNTGHGKYIKSAGATHSGETVSFGSITYTEPGEYDYEIKEVLPDGVNESYPVANVSDGTNSKDVVYDTAVHSAHVSVTDTGLGTLNAVVTYDDSTENDPAAVFTNRLAKDGTIQLTASKTLTGGLLHGGEFHYTLYQKTGSSVKELGETSNDETGAISAVIPISHSEAEDNGKTFYFTMVEQHAGETINGVKYDSEPLNIMVKVDSISVNNNWIVRPTSITYTKGNTTCTDVYNYAENNKVTVEHSGTHPSFENSYHSEGRAFLNVSKHITGRNWKADDSFAFTLSGKDGAPVRTGSDSASEQSESISVTADEQHRIVSFADLYFNEGDLAKNEDGSYRDTDYTYIIHEQCLVNDVDQNPAKGGYQKDGMTYAEDQEITVHLHDNGLGSIEVTYGEKRSNTAENLQFVNTYDTSSTEAEIQVSKKLEGRPWLKDDSFSFTLQAGSNTADTDTPMPSDPTVTVTRDSQKTASADTYTASFGNITFTRPGTYYYYTIEQNIPKDAVNNVKDGITYDNARHDVIVTVTDQGDGTMKAAVRYGETGSSVPAVFTNTYEPESVTLDIKAQKQLIGYNLSTGMFAMNVYLEDPAKNPEAEVLNYMTNDENGIFLSHAITFTRDELNALADQNNGTVVKDKDENGLDRWTVTVYMQEAEGDNSAVTYDQKVHTAEAVIRDNGRGKLKAEIVYDNDASLKDTGPLITNVYQSKGSASLQARKHIANREWLPDESFTFAMTLKDADGSPMHTEGSEEGSKVLTAVADSHDRTAVFPTLVYTQDDLAVKDKKGKIIGYQEDKDFTYVIHEECMEDGSDLNTAEHPAVKDGLTYAADKTIMVHVHDNGDGTMQVTYGADHTNTPKEEDISFENVYQPSDGEAEIEVEKQLSGRDFRTGESYTFTLTGDGPLRTESDGNEADHTSLSVKTDEEHKAVFHLYYTPADLQNAGEHTYTYTLHEEVPEGAVQNADGTWTKDHVTYAEDQIIYVRIRDNARGGIETSYGTDGNFTSTAVTVKNVYTPDVPEESDDETGSVILQASKVLEGRDWTDSDSFTFTLKGSDSAVLRVKENGSDQIRDSLQVQADRNHQTVSFPELCYQKSDLGGESEKTFVYTLHEEVPEGAVQNADGTWTKDHLTYSADQLIYVHVTDDSGSLKAEYGTDPEATNGQITVRNTYDSVPGKTSLTVYKEWADGASGERAVVVVKNGDEEAARAELNESNGWTHTFDELPKYNRDGSEIAYTVDEITDSYDYTVEKNEDGSYTITNSPKTAKTSLHVRKEWADGASGESATVVLTRNGEETGDSVELNENNGWSHTFTDLDQYDENGDAYTYSVVEKTNDYDVTYTVENGTVIVTNRPKTPENEEDHDQKISIPVEKTWAKGRKTSSVTMALIRDGEQIGTVELNEANGWKSSFDNVDEYAEDGHAYSYSVQEVGRWMYARSIDIHDNVSVHNFSLPVTPGSSVTELTVYKKWAAGLKPEAVQVRLLQDGIAVSDEQTLSADNSWTVTFCNLPVDDGNGHTYEYSVEETGGRWQYTLTKNADGSITITNGSSSVNTGVSDHTALYWMMLGGAALLFILLKKYGKKYSE
jgi:pilin isopeptide linkage protein